MVLEWNLILFYKYKFQAKIRLRFTFLGKKNWWIIDGQVRRELVLEFSSRFALLSRSWFGFNFLLPICERTSINNFHWQQTCANNSTWYCYSEITRISGNILGQILYVHSLMSYNDSRATINPYSKSKISEDQTIFLTFVQL